MAAPPNGVTGVVTPVVVVLFNMNAPSFIFLSFSFKNLSNIFGEEVSSFIAVFLGDDDDDDDEGLLPFSGKYLFIS